MNMLSELKNNLSSISSGISSFYRSLSLRTFGLAYRNRNFILFACGVTLLSVGLSTVAHAQFQSPNYNDTLIRNVIGNLFAMIEGAFGALVMVVAGLFAIIAAAMGSYRSAISMLIVALGAFILRALVSLFFGQDFEDFNAGNNY